MRYMRSFIVLAIVLIATAASAQYTEAEFIKLAMPNHGVGVKIEPIRSISNSGGITTNSEPGIAPVVTINNPVFLDDDLYAVSVERPADLNLEVYVGGELIAGESAIGNYSVGLTRKGQFELHGAGMTHEGFLRLIGAAGEWIVRFAFDIPTHPIPEILPIEVEGDAFNVRPQATWMGAKAEHLVIAESFAIVGSNYAVAAWDQDNPDYKASMDPSTGKASAMKVPLELRKGILSAGSIYAGRNGMKAVKFAVKHLNGGYSVSKVYVARTRASEVKPTPSSEPISPIMIGFRPIRGERGFVEMTVKFDTRGTIGGYFFLHFEAQRSQTCTEGPWGWLASYGDTFDFIGGGGDSYYYMRREYVPKEMTAIAAVTAFLQKPDGSWIVRYANATYAGEHGSMCEPPISITPVPK